MGCGASSTVNTPRATQPQPLVGAIDSGAPDVLRTVRSGSQYVATAQTVHSALAQALADNDAALIDALELSAQEREAPPFPSEHPGLTPLLWACGFCSATVVQALLRAQCDVTAVSPSGHTALMLAVSSTHQSAERITVELLGQSSTDVLAKDSLQLTAFHYATQHAKSVRTVNLLLDSTTYLPHIREEMLNTIAGDSSTALMLAVQNKYDLEADILNLLLHHGLGTQLGARDVNGCTAFHHACRSAPSSKHISTLIHAGADPSAASTDGSTGLIFAAQNANSEVIWDLLKLAPQVAETIDTANTHGWTALHYACHFGRATSAEALVTACCNVAATTPTGKTGLMLAAQYSEGTEACRVLLEWSPDELELRDANGNTARALAAAAGHTDTAQLLAEKESAALRQRAAAAQHRSSTPATNEYEAEWTNNRTNVYVSAARADLTHQVSAFGQPQPEPQPPRMPTHPLPLRPQSLEASHTNTVSGQRFEEEDSEELSRALELSAMHEQIAQQQRQLEAVQLAQAIAESKTAEASRLLAIQQREATEREASRAEADKQEAAARRDNAAEVRRLADQAAVDQEERRRIEAQEKVRQTEQMRSRLDSAFEKFQQRRQERQEREAAGRTTDPQLGQKQHSATEKLEAALAKMRKRREAKQIATGRNVDVTRETLEKEARRLFNAVDKDCSGHLDAKEVKELTRKLRLDLCEEEIQAAMEKMDVDGNGEVDFDEFFGWYVNSIE